MQSGLAAVHDPQSPPQPSEPQTLPVQSGVQPAVHTPAVQVSSVLQPLPQMPQLLVLLPRATQVLLQQESPLAHGQAPLLAVSGVEPEASVVASLAASVETTWLSVAASRARTGASGPGAIGPSRAGTSGRSEPESTTTTGPESTAMAAVSVARGGPSTVGIAAVSSLRVAASAAAPSAIGAGAASLLPLLLLPHPANTRGAANNNRASERCTSLVIFLFLSFGPLDAETHRRVGILHAKGFFATRLTGKGGNLFKDV